MLNSQGFDIWAENYDRDVAATDAADGYPFAGYTAVLRRVRAAVRGGDVMDIGFGTGELLARLSQDGCRVTGIDFSEKMIDRAKEKLPDAELLQHDIAKGWPDALEGRMFDAIVSTYALHHLEEAEHAAFLRTLFRHLKPGGVLAVGDVSFGTEAERDAARAAAGDEWDEAEHYFVYERLQRSLGLPARFERMSFCAGVLTLRKPKMLLFDYGGTLGQESAFDTLAGMRAVMEHATHNRDGLSAEEVSVFNDEHFLALDPVRLERLVEVHEHPLDRFVYEYLGLSFDISPVERELLFWNGGMQLSPKPGAPALLAALCAQGIRTGVISNIMFSGEALTAQLARMFPEHAFEFVIASSEYVYRKPSRWIFTLALKKAGLDPEDVWYLGDRFDCDVEGPAALGIPAVWIPAEYDGRALPNGCAVLSGFQILTPCFA